MESEAEESAGALERMRSWLVWLCVTVFVSSFAGLLALSATPYWMPGNPAIGALDTAWRTSLAAGLLLWLIPRLAQALRWLGDLFSGKPEGA